MTEIIIRAAELDDVDDLWELFQMPRVQRGTLQLPYQSRQTVKKRLEERSADDYVLVAVDKETQKVVGSIGLHRSKAARLAHSAHIGMSVRDDYQGQGIGSKLMEAILNLADKWLNLQRIELTVYVDNEPAIKLYKKYGFVIEGTLRKYAYREGAFVDTYTMARIKD